MKQVNGSKFPWKLLGMLFILIGFLASVGCSSLPFTQTQSTVIPAPSQSDIQQPDVVPPPSSGVSSEFIPDVEINLKASPSQVQILPGQPTKVWTYQGTLVKGDATNLTTLQNSYLGPLIHVRKGQKVRVRFTNDLPQPSIIHWHGLLVSSRTDGHPRDAIQPGQTYVYEFEVVNRAGTYWFHPHPEPLTGTQVMNGLAGLFVVSDDEEIAANLPSGAYDVPVVIQDRTFDQNNQFVGVQGDTMPGMAGMEALMGFLGERILVNGQETPLLPVASRAYRLRILNGSNSRVYKLSWSHGAPLTVIATDGGLLEHPVVRSYVMLGPGERIELWADFRQFPVGTEITLQSLPFLGAEGDSLLDGGSSMPGMDMGMDHGGMMGMGETPTPSDGNQNSGDMSGYNPKLPNGAGFPILKIRIDRQEQETLSLPANLSVINREKVEQAVNWQQPRRFGLSMRNGSWLINGRSFKLEDVAPDEIVKPNSLEVWEFVNEQNPNEMMEKMGMVHPMHIHGVQFQVIDRQMLTPTLKAGWDSVREGYVDEGWKDTVLVMPGEKVTLLIRINNFTDLFLYHCHNLEHEDLGMMRNYSSNP
jgi:FtsP/CotA-like multicopper oxidase with cupredoxin domain